MFSVYRPKFPMSRAVHLPLDSFYQDNNRSFSLYHHLQPSFLRRLPNAYRCSCVSLKKMAPAVTVAVTITDDLEMVQQANATRKAPRLFTCKTGSPYANGGVPEIRPWDESVCCHPRDRHLIDQRAFFPLTRREFSSVFIVTTHLTWLKGS